MDNFKTYKFNKHNFDLEIRLYYNIRQIFQSNSNECKPKLDGILNITEGKLSDLFFFEWQKFEFEFFCKDDNPKELFKFIINDRTLKESKFKSPYHLLSGQYSFQDIVGDTIIEIKDIFNNTIFSLTTEVFPQKMDYKSDYQAMMSDITSIIQNLAFDLFKDTYKKSKVRSTGKATINEWWNILDKIFIELFNSLNIIKRQPKSEIKREESVLPIEKIKSSSKKTVSWFLKNSKISNNQRIGLKVTDNNYFTEALSVKKYITFDTYENRFVTWAIKNTLDLLKKYKSLIDKESNGMDYTLIIDRIKTYQGKLQGILHENPFNEVKEFEKRYYYSATLQRGTGYREFLYFFILLSKGLDIANNDIFKIEIKNISTLYEYWCFLELVKLAKENLGYDIIDQDIIKLTHNKFKIELSKGNQSKVELKNQMNETVTLYYNKEFRKKSNSTTYNQIPDYSLKFTKEGFEKPFWYIFDAKYRFEEDPKAEKVYNVPQETIGQLHRYRDAILHSTIETTTYRSAIKNLGGIILFPYPLDEDIFKSNEFYKTISEVNIGALPFLPSKTKLVSNFLKELFWKLPENLYEENIEMDRSEYENNRIKWNSIVTIGLIPLDNNILRDQFIKENLIYHIRYDRNLNSRIFQTKYVLIYNPTKTESYLYNVTNFEILTDLELKEKGVNWTLNSNKYLVFKLSNDFKILKIESLILRSGFRYTTESGLNYFEKTGNKDFLYITNPNSYRLYQELIKLKVKYKFEWVSDKNNPTLVRFIINDEISITSSDYFKPLMFRYKNQIIHIKEILNIIQNELIKPPSFV